MVLLKPIAGLMLLAASGVSLALSEATVSGDNLNVRKTPNGTLVDQLVQSQLVKVVTEQEGWSQIIYLKVDSDSVSYGWVSSQYLEAIFEPKSTECVEDPSSGENLCLAVAEPNLQCKLDSESSTYSSCTINIQYELTGVQNYQEPQSIRCLSRLNTKADASEPWRTEMQSLTVPHNASNSEEAIASMDIWFGFGEENPASFARISDTSCDLEFGEKNPAPPVD